MQLFDPSGKRVTVMGLGLQQGGLGVTRWLVNHGAIVTVTDLKEREELESALKQLEDIKSKIHFVLGEHREKDFISADLVIKGQGVPSSSKYLLSAREAGVEVDTDIGIFVRNFPGKIVGVTGTKGKTTVTTLLNNILSNTHRDVLLGGNIRRSPLDGLDKATPETIALLELSSFQLEIFATHKFSPHVAIWTNLYPDHLDRYESMNEYAAAKANIFMHQKKGDTFVINADQKELNKYADKAPANLRSFSAQSEQPQGTFLRDDEIVRAHDGEEEVVGKRSSLKIPGEHNIENVLAAAEAARVLGVPAKIVRETIETFRGVENRLEIVREHAGVTYINDTASTIPISAAVAVGSFSQPMVLIAGGSEKHLPLEPLISAITKSKSLTALVLFDAPASHRIAQKLKEADSDRAAQLLVKPFATSMQQALTLAEQRASEGGIVLLSPGSASFGMFVNEFDRGDQFVEVVKAL